MESLTGKFRIAPKAGWFMFGALMVGMVMLWVVPRDWHGVRTIAAMLMSFCIGMNVAQHARIWERSDK